MSGYIINGKFVKGDAEKQVSSNSPQFKAWSHAEQRRNHAAEIVQPYKDGKPNEDFKAIYVEESKARGFLLRDEELRNK